MLHPAAMRGARPDSPCRQGFRDRCFASYHCARLVNVLTQHCFHDQPGAFQVPEGLADLVSRRIGPVENRAMAALIAGLHVDATGVFDTEDASNGNFFLGHDQAALSVGLNIMNGSRLPPPQRHKAVTTASPGTLPGFQGSFWRDYSRNCSRSRISAAVLMFESADRTSFRGSRLLYLAGS